MRHYRFTEYTQLLFFSLLHSKNPLNSCWIYLPQNPATMMCRKGFPNELSEKITCQTQVDSNPWHLLARIRCDSSSRDWLARESPLPHSESPSRTRPANPPRAPCNGGGGGGGRLTRLAYASWTGTFPFILPYMVNLHVLYEHIRILYRADWWIKA